MLLCHSIATLWFLRRKQDRVQTLCTFCARSTDGAGWISDFNIALVQKSRIFRFGKPKQPVYTLIPKLLKRPIWLFFCICLCLFLYLSVLSRLIFALQNQVHCKMWMEIKRKAALASIHINPFQAKMLVLKEGQWIQSNPFKDRYDQV